MMFKPKPKYELKEINDYIANYFDILINSPPGEDNLAMLAVMRQVVDRMNKYLLTQAEGKK